MAPWGIDARPNRTSPARLLEKSTPSILIYLVGVGEVYYSTSSELTVLVAFSILHRQG